MPLWMRCSLKKMNNESPFCGYRRAGFLCSAHRLREIFYPAHERSPQIGGRCGCVVRGVKISPRIKGRAPSGKGRDCPVHKKGAIKGAMPLPHAEKRRAITVRGVVSPSAMKETRIIGRGAKSPHAMKDAHKLVGGAIRARGERGQKAGLHVSCRPALFERGQILSASLPRRRSIVFLTARKMFS